MNVKDHNLKIWERTCRLVTRPQGVRSHQVSVAFKGGGKEDERTLLGCTNVENARDDPLVEGFGGQNEAKGEGKGPYQSAKGVEEGEADIDGEEEVGLGKGGEGRKCPDGTVVKRKAEEERETGREHSGDRGITSSLVLVQLRKVGIHLWMRQRPIG